MILSNDRTQAISNLGWVDRGALWLHSIGSNAHRRIALSDAKYITLVPGRNDFFAAVQHWDGDRLEITAHHHSQPEKIISRASVQQRIPLADAKLKIVFEGDSSVWSRLPAAYVGYAFGKFRLIQTITSEDDEIQEFDWYDDSYDKGYQGIIGVTEIRDSRNLIISVQRDSNPVLYDPKIKKSVKKLWLANRRGNPEFLSRPSANEFWASDYDSIVKLDSNTLVVKDSLRVQDSAPGTESFIGNFCFNADESVCVIARPFTRDVILIESDSLRRIDAVKLAGEPLDIALLADGTLVARDWKTGEFMSAKLKES